jgi:hypothetical protein
LTTVGPSSRLAEFGSAMSVFQTTSPVFCIERHQFVERGEINEFAKNLDAAIVGTAAVKSSRAPSCDRNARLLARLSVGA